MLQNMWRQNGKGLTLIKVKIHKKYIKVLFKCMNALKLPKRQKLTLCCVGRSKKLANFFPPSDISLPRIKSSPTPLQTFYNDFFLSIAGSKMMAAANCSHTLGLAKPHRWFYTQRRRTKPSTVAAHPTRITANICVCCEMKPTRQSITLICK